MLFRINILILEVGGGDFGENRKKKSNALVLLFEQQLSNARENDGSFFEGVHPQHILVKKVVSQNDSR